MDTADIPQEFIISFFQVAKIQSYNYVAATTLVIHDAILLFRKEVQHIYRGGWSLIKGIYVLIRLFAFLDLPFLVHYTTNVFDSISECKVVTWVTGFARYVGFTCIIKTLLAIRLRALYGNSLKVTLLLCLTTAVELLTVVYFFLLVSISTQISGILPVPFPGCIPATSDRLIMLADNAAAVMWAARLFSNTVEVALTLGKLYHSLTSEDGNLRWRLERIKYWRPILYVFYRDGTMFFIPMFILSILGLLDALRVLQVVTSWSMWLSLVYCTCGTRLILNLRIANCKLTESTAANRMSTIRFRHHQLAPRTENYCSGDSLQPSTLTSGYSLKTENPT